ncbi:family 2 glycosyl transferase [Halorientalis sp. IM1011]|nr:family 2 glycosyl transferase [Halorientalis sp. IM1011]
MPELSVIVPSLSPPSELPVVQRLDRTASADFELLVRDDQTVTAARNAGIRRASADKLVFLDDDSRPCEGYLSRAASVLDREAAVAGRTVHPRDDVFARRLTGHYDFGPESRYVDRFWGCNMAVRADVFDTVGTWNEGFSWGHEEKELADRVRESFPIYYDPDLVVAHSYADSIPDYWHKMYRLETQTPYYWECRGVSRRRQWLRIVQYALDPTNYAGLSPPHAAARFGGSVAKTLGRLRGMVR